MNEPLRYPSRVLVALIEDGVGTDDAKCDREQVAPLGECTVGIGISYSTYKRAMSVLADLNKGGR
jgi:hypothetical protein